MNIAKIAYADFFNATIVTPDMIVDLARGLGLSDEYIAKMQAQKLAKSSGGKGGKSSGAADCPDAKLRTIVLQKLQQPNDLVTDFAHGNTFEFEFACLPDDQPEPDINAAGANKQRKARSTGRKQGLTGAYRVAKRGLKCTVESDPAKFALWQFVWECKSFEEYFAKAPAKAVTRTNRIITATSEMLWAVKCGWIVPVGNEAE